MMAVTIEIQTVTVTNTDNKLTFHKVVPPVLAIWKWEVIEKSIASRRVGDRWWSIIIGLLAM